MPNKGFKSGKSSKTARVLNLLTDPESVETAVEPAPAAISPADSASTMLRPTSEPASMTRVRTLLRDCRGV